MASEWAEEADRQAKAMTRDLIETGRTKGFRVEYQKREARFALRAGTITVYFSAHDYKTRNGIDWLKLRIDVLTSVRNGGVVQQAEVPVDAADDVQDETSAQ